MIYTNENRGAIQFRDRRRQILDCSGLRYGNITPTDCDVMIEYHNRAYIISEIKYRDAIVPRGQLMALVRSIDDYKKAGKYALLIIAEHSVDNPAEDINAAECIVREWYTDTWRKPLAPVTLKTLINKFIAFVDGGQHE